MATLELSARTKTQVGLTGKGCVMNAEKRAVEQGGFARLKTKLIFIEILISYRGLNYE